MNRDSGLAGALLMAAWGATLGASSTALAQNAAPADAAARASAAAPATTDEQPRRGRDRRRSAAAADATPAPRAPAADAAPAAAAAVVAEPVAESVESTVVCKNIKLTGTKISRRICGSPEQWAAQEKRTTDDAQEAMRQVRDRSSIVVSQPDNPLSPGGN